MPLGSKHMQVIHVAKRRLGLNDDQYRDILKRFGGVESARDLDHVGFDQVMAYFRHLGFTSDGRKRYYGGVRVGMASPEQVKLIRALWSEYTGVNGDEKGLDRWIKGTFEVESLRFVDKTTAHKVVGALMQMKRRCRRSQRSAI
ncbi:hypothetical protein CCR80_06855 [Rhodothalassium salexigens]|uniref:regulatory protein GemA n=1 Tax=Rhodothalassium salexigens TaxID=1086 RepID=UPI0019143554|nr:regulatory protein GemA [Rhodothalassium salexigens]MBK5920753.1 hypothetical protein [Rhodothalassium salexigens]